MPYPTLSLEAAQSIDQSRRDYVPFHVDSYTIWKPGENFVESTAIDCLNQCCDLVEVAKETTLSRSEFDSQCARLLHAALKLPVRVAGDADFWRWLTFAQGAYGAEIVDWRYGNRAGDLAPNPARAVYYGLGPMKKGMFAKLWICANTMNVADQPNPYDGIEYADVDLWDSHIIDVDYGSVPAVARAFVKVVRDLDLPRGGPRELDKPAGYRDLAKEIRRRNATVAFELFSDVEAYDWVVAVWDERQTWSRR